MVDLDAALLHHLPELSIADRVGDMPAHAPQDHITFEMAALELDHPAIPHGPLSASQPMPDPRQKFAATMRFDRIVL